MDSAQLKKIRISIIMKSGGFQNKIQIILIYVGIVQNNLKIIKKIFVGVIQIKIIFLIVGEVKTIVIKIQIYNKWKQKMIMI